ncbi:MAG: hypothetical protein PHI13_13760 [Methylococcales bacterium]|nr:hypothetical protein [Methylococcales bacterium]
MVLINSRIIKFIRIGLAAYKLDSSPVSGYSLQDGLRFDGTVNLFSTHRSHPEQPTAQEFFVILR